METRCPDCDKRLRLPETYSNQRIRCRNCGTIFRPADLETEVQVEAPEPVGPDEVAAETPAERRSMRPAHSPSPSRPIPRSRSGGGGLGIAIVIILMLIVRVPRLIKNFGDRDRKKPVPVEIREDNMQALQEVLQDIEDGPVEGIKVELGAPDAGQDQPDDPLNEDPRSRDNDDAAEFRS